jgi:hypothetical protein
VGIGGKKYFGHITNAPPNTRNTSRFANPSTSLWLIVACSSSLLCFSNAPHSFVIVNDCVCCWLLCFGARQAVVCLEFAPDIQNNIVVSWLPSSLPNSWLLHPPVKPRPLDRPKNRLEPVENQCCFIGPPSWAHLVLKSSSSPPSPHFCSSAKAVSSAPRQNWRPHWQRRQGKGRHQWWCWMALVAIVRWFRGHRTWFRWSIDELMAGCVVSCAWKKYGTCTYSHKWRSSLFSTAH